MIEPLLKEDAFLADVHASRADTPNSLRLWWLGQSGFLLQIAGRHLLLDPYLSDSLTVKYAGTDKPHVRMTRLVIGPQRLGFVDVITSTHNHTDHLDAQTLVRLTRAAQAQGKTPLLVLPAANQEFAAQRLREAPPLMAPMLAGQTREAGGFCFTAIPASHDQLTLDDQGRNIYLGYVVKAGPWVIYHSGDTVLYDGMVQWLRPFNIDLALLPINGKLGNMNGVDAARLAKQIGARCVVPCHYEMFEFNTADPREQFIPECERLAQAYHVLRAGQWLTLTP